MSQSISAVPRRHPCGRRRPVGYDRAAPLKPIDLEAHTQLLGAHQIMSGRGRGYVYWWRKGKLHWRRYVVPRDPRTPAQQCSRTAFGTASKACSDNNALTQEQRDAWQAAAAKIKSHPRLGQCGPLTAQQHIVGTNCRKERWGLQLLLEPPTGGRKKAECRMQNTTFSAQVQQPQNLVRPTWEPRRACTRPVPDLPEAAKGCTGRRAALRVPTQVCYYQALTRTSSERPHTPSLCLPVQYRWQSRSPSPVRSIGLPCRSSAFPQMCHNAHSRELWRGG